MKTYKDQEAAVDQSIQYLVIPLKVMVDIQAALVKVKHRERKINYVNQSQILIKQQKMNKTLSRS